MLSTLLLWPKFLHYFGQYPTLYNFLAISPEELSHWEYFLANPNKYANPKIFQPTVLPAPLYEWTPSVNPPKSGQVLHHMHDSGGSPDVSICHTFSRTNSLSVCQFCYSSVC